MTYELFLKLIGAQRLDVIESLVKKKQFDLQELKEWWIELCYIDSIDFYNVISIDCGPYLTITDFRIARPILQRRVFDTLGIQDL